MGKHALAAAEDSAPVQTVTPPAGTSPVSKVSTGRPGAAALKAASELNVIDEALAGDGRDASHITFSTTIDRPHLQRLRVASCMGCSPIYDCELSARVSLDGPSLVVNAHQQLR